MADGKAGAPRGNSNAAKGKRWANAIEKALDRRSKAEGQEALVDLAEKLLAACSEGDIRALTELGNRLDGKPNQSVDMKVTDMSHEEALEQLIKNEPNRPTAH